MTQKYPENTGALFAGTFNPFTIGHADIVRRGVEMFGRVVICLGINMEKPDCEAPMRALEIKALYVDEPRVSVIWWAGLTTEAAKEHGCNVLLRGVRSVKDFEYERDLPTSTAASRASTPLCSWPGPNWPACLRRWCANLSATTSTLGRISLSPMNQICPACVADLFPH